MTEFVPSQSSSLGDWLSYLEGIHPKNIDMGLSRVSEVAHKMGLLDLKSRIILIAGTNGKGTTARCLESLLLTQNYTVGTYASPHLIRYNERVRVNGAELPDSYHVDAFHALEVGRGQTSLTYFEYGTLGALEIFKRTEPDFILLEVGLGGRLDATNIVSPEASIVTTIDLDHKEYLGDTRELVGREKAGIFRKDILAVVGDLNIPNSVIGYANEVGADLVRANSEYCFSDDGEIFNYQSEQLSLTCATPRIPSQNVATALTTLARLNLLPAVDVVIQTLANLQVEGRFQALSDTQYIFVDVAHNPESARYLKQKLSQYKSQGVAVHAICGMLQDKDQLSVVNELKGVVDTWSLASLHCFRGAQASQLQDVMIKAGINSVEEYDSVSTAMSEAVPNLTKQELLIIFGSFYTVADAIQFWQNRGETE